MFANITSWFWGGATSSAPVVSTPSSQKVANTSAPTISSKPQGRVSPVAATQRPTVAADIGGNTSSRMSPMKGKKGKSKTKHANKSSRRCKPHPRTGATHAVGKWRAPTRRGDATEEDSLCCVCTTHASGNLSTCTTCESSYCERPACHTQGGIDVFQTCHWCELKGCRRCRQWVTTSVLSGQWKGEERFVSFCDTQCAYQALKQCQRSQNPVTPMF